MTSLQDIQKVRQEKIELLKKAGMEAYPARVLREISLKDARQKFTELSITLPEQISEKQFTVAGRIMAIRGQGAILFAVLDDGSGVSANNNPVEANATQVGRLQIVIKKDVMNADLFDLFSSAVDIGDFISVTGKLYVTKRGEQSILADSWVMATKSLSPLPDKWHGLQDEDARFRKRYLDFVMNPSMRDLFAKKSLFWQVTRRELISAGFLEVETPTLEVTTGGAEATPFKTHHNDFDLDVYLRISVGELWQKRLMAAGFDRTFEIGRVYRNEGSSPDHLQEFTNMEFYASWMDYKEGIKFTENLIKKLAKEVFGKYEFSTRGHSFNLDGEWKVIEYVDTVKEMTGIDVLTASVEEMKATLDKLHVKYDGDNKERLTDTLWKYCRKRISGPAWLIHHPKLVSPLSKSVVGRPELTERVQLILAGAEVTNGFSELNDPIDQRSRFELQQKLIERGDSEAMMPEWDFVEMLETGMPPTFGFAYGDRLFAFLSDKTGREIQMFPLMKPLNEEGGTK